MEDEPIPYKDACIKMGPDYYDYEHYEPKWGQSDKFEVIRSLGRGKYSEVFKGIDTESGKFCAVKVLKPVRKSKIMREIKILETLRGGPNIIQLYDCCYDQMSKTICQIFEFICEKNFKELQQNLSDIDIRFYLYQILKAQDYCHAKGIMHRDVKPMNIIVDKDSKTLRQLDWGLSEYYQPDKEYNVRVASRPFKGPELLIGYQKYDYSQDIWSTGCIFAAMIFKKEHVFQGRDNLEQLIKITNVLGTQDLYKYMEKYNVRLEPNEYASIGTKAKKEWSSFINNENAHQCSPEALELLSRMLIYDHAKRITAKKAMAHKFFDPVRHMVQELLLQLRERVITTAEQFQQFIDICDKQRKEEER